MRYLKTSTGDWLSRDPIGEPGFALLQGSGDSQIPEYDAEDLDSDGDPVEFDGGANEMGFVNNDPVNAWDMLGMASGGKIGSPKDPPSTPKKPTPKKPKKTKPYKVKNVLITFYCSCKICCGPNAVGLCADGTKACQGTLAADWKVFPKGSKITFTLPDGTVVSGTVHDTGIKVNGKHLDVWCSDHEKASTSGRWRVTVTVTPP